MRRLTVLSGPGAPLGLRARSWLRAQAPFLPVDVVDPASPRARARWPGLPPPTAHDDLSVLDDDGALWRGDAAWLMVLWALRRHRREALSLAARGRAGEARARVSSLVASAGGDPSGLAAAVGRVLGAFLALLLGLWGTLAVAVWAPWALAACAVVGLLAWLGRKALFAIVPAVALALLAPADLGMAALVAALVGLPFLAIALGTRGLDTDGRSRGAGRGPRRA